MGAAACGEVTRLNCDGQFKPCVYLNGGMGGEKAAVAGTTRRHRQRPGDLRCGEPVQHGGRINRRVSNGDQVGRVAALALGSESRWTSRGICCAMPRTANSYFAPAGGTVGGGWRLRQNTGNFGLQSRRRVRCRAGPSAFYKLRDDTILPVICPTCQNVFAGSPKHPCQRRRVTLHGVVFDILVWGEHRVPQTRKAPPCGRAFLALAQFRFELAISLRTGSLARTIRVLLLLARLLAAALLLAGLLPRVLVLLTRVLVLAGHRGLPCLDQVRDNALNPAWFRWNFRFPTNCLRREAA